MKLMPDWIVNLDDEDITFIKKFILASGSLKEIAQEYNVTYPTVRLRLDRLIQKIHLNEEKSKQPYVALIKKLALDGKMDFETAKILVTEYEKEERNG